MKTPSFVRTSLRLLARLALPVSLCATMAATAANVDLADKPLFATTNSVPGNLLLDLSVEFPTANSAGYFSTTPYSSSTLYLGYFDGTKCYQYLYGPDQNQIPALTAMQSYFQAASPSNYTSASPYYTCTSTSSTKLWSGNWLNYSTMQGLDIFRWVLTGGNRIVDSTSMTVLQRATHSGQGGSGDAPNKVLATGDESGATPLGFASAVNTRVWGAGIQMWFSVSGDLSPNSVASTDYSDRILGSLDGSKIYGVYINVRVCDPSVSLEANCVKYVGGNNDYKPEGLMQQYSQTLRYGTFGYLGDSDVNRDGGVLRGRMAYIAPTQPVPGSTAITNLSPEWDASTGIMYLDPDPIDSQATTAAIQKIAKTATPVSKSGVMNYLNKFGYTTNKYKVNDPVSELYYASTRYLKGQSNVSTYTSMTGSSGSAIDTYVDGFPVITSWATDNAAYDPIVYSCQKNFILGIGDVNTHHDADLPGSTLLAHEPSPQPPEVLADSTIDNGLGVAEVTNTIGTMEKSTNKTLASAYIFDYGTYYIGGLAYDIHLPISGHGLRTFTDSSSGTAVTTISTASTYWLDVQEYQTYVNNNQYYYATKYGGFTVPAGYTFGTPLTQDSWYTTTNTQGSSKQKQPDNYFTAANAVVMQSGLISAFAKIAAENGTGNGTALSTSRPNVTQNGSVTYSATYDATTWTGNVTASTLTFNTEGSTTEALSWDARSLLSAASVTASTRQIVTCCNASGTPGLPFTNTALSTATLNPRTYYTSFGNITGVSTSSQSIANYIAYLRGDTSQEVANGGAYRTRAYRLGDIVNSKTTVVGAPGYQFYDTYNPGYSKFKSTYANRRTVVYIGANDGMLHAFDGTTGNATSGQELFAYIPSFTYGNSTTAATSGLASLGVSSFVHHYFVDATVGQFDVDFDKAGTPTGTTGTPDWHTVVIGGLGKGGKGYYAIDVTDPSATSWSSESAVAGKVLWEFTDSRMGYTYGVPSVVKTKKYGWVVVFSSGYTNADGMGYFFFVNPKTGALLETVSTPTGSGTTSTPLDLGQQSAYVENYVDDTADSIYGGDLQGNVWRVDVSASNLTLPYSTAVKIAAFGSSQPITTRPLIEVPPNSTTRYVLVGTGKLLGNSDIQSSTPQAFYAIIDGFSASGQFYGSTGNPVPTGYSFPITPNQLNAIAAGTGSGSLITGIGSNPTSAMGWYYTLPIDSGVAERINIDPFANQGIVTFTGNATNGSACSPAGNGVNYTVNFATGQTVLLGSDGVSLVISQALNGLGTENTILSVSGNLGVYTGSSKGIIQKQNALLTSAGNVVQINWRDVPASN